LEGLKDMKSKPACWTLFRAYCKKNIAEHEIHEFITQLPQEMLFDEDGNKLKKPKKFLTKETIGEHYLFDLLGRNP
jgi:hypothetical protein